MARGGQVKRWEYYEVATSTAEGLFYGAMDRAGAVGWELVSVVFDGKAWHKFYKRPLGLNDYPSWRCRLMNLLDFRYWRCECEYVAPYGKVISADCERHG